VTPSWGEWYVELDADGVWGNGPDEIYAEYGAYHDVDVVAHGEGPIRAFKVTICDHHQGLALQQVTYLTPEGWTTVPAVPGECVVVEASIPSLTGVPLGGAGDREGAASWGSVKGRFREHDSAARKTTTTNPLPLPAVVAHAVYFMATEHSYDPLTVDDADYIDVEYNPGEFTGNVGCTFLIGVWSARSPHLRSAVRP
jgi:hypothetical protein